MPLPSSVAQNGDCEMARAQVAERCEGCFEFTLTSIDTWVRQSREFARLVFPRYRNEMREISFGNARRDSGQRTYVEVAALLKEFARVGGRFG